MSAGAVIDIESPPPYKEAHHETVQIQWALLIIEWIFFISGGFSMICWYYEHESLFMLGAATFIGINTYFLHHSKQLNYMTVFVMVLLLMVGNIGGKKMAYESLGLKYNDGRLGVSQK